MRKTLPRSRQVFLTSMYRIRSLENMFSMEKAYEENVTALEASVSY
jgi:hypothetical protein